LAVNVTNYDRHSGKKEYGGQTTSAGFNAALPDAPHSSNLLTHSVHFIRYQLLAISCQLKAES
jgi:hypothetical protein